MSERSERKQTEIQAMCVARSAELPSPKGEAYGVEPCKGEKNFLGLGGGKGIWGSGRGFFRGWGWGLRRGVKVFWGRG